MNGIHNSHHSYQQGLGLVEVMVALLLLSVAILGFSAMQQLATKATEESVIRTQALSVIRGGAEMMRANPLGIKAFKTALNATASPDVDRLNGITLNSCLGISANCSIEQMATRDAIAITTHVKQNNQQIAMLSCPTIAPTVENSDKTVILDQERQCFVISWGKTTPKFDDNDSTACANADGNYKISGQCFIIESY